jgi:hypothetical protein
MPPLESHTPKSLQKHSTDILEKVLHISPPTLALKHNFLGATPLCRNV